MSYFSRLTDIITCNLSSLLADSDNPGEALDQIIREMDEGLSGAKRSVAAAGAAEQRLLGEITEHRSQAAQWATEARRLVTVKDDNGARQSLLRKREVEDLIAGLDQQHAAAVTTREHLSTMLRALEARIAEARRRQAALAAAPHAAASSPTASGSSTWQDESADASSRDDQIEAELEALRRELGAT